jgi:drug/metabolite transporter superfamily protein YnfA
MAGADLFVSVFVVHGWLRPDYSPMSMFVSELSLGPYGWVQTLNFLLTGALVLVFGRGLAAHFNTGAASRAGPALVQGMGVSLMVSGVFATDPSAMFDRASAHGVVHGIVGAVFFTLAPVGCFVFYRRFRSDRAWRPLAGWTLSAGVVLCLGIVLLKISQQPASGLFEWKGLVQRLILVTIMAWIFAVASRLHHLSRDGEPGPQTNL